MPKFIPGLKLSKLYYEKEVKLILNKHFPDLKHIAGLFGWGSEVLGYDTAISRDHNWGPTIFIFLSEKDYPKLKDKMNKVLAENLPYDFMGYSTNYGTSELNGVKHAVKINSGLINHMVGIYTIKSFLKCV